MSDELTTEKWQPPRRPEWLLALRGWPAFMFVVHVIPAHWRLWLWLLPYAGDWAYRADRLEIRRNGW
jgi:hypothetical protein